MTNLDIWAIQFYGNELYNALSNIKKEGPNILFTNCMSQLKIGKNNIISRQFDTCLYSEENDLLILLMRDGEKTSQDIRDYLNERGIPFHEVIFSNLEDKYKNDPEVPELWFAREKYVLEDAIKDSKEKNNYSCVFYPNVNSKLSIRYHNERELSIPLDKRLFKGLIKFDDKLVLMINQGDVRNMNTQDIISTLMSHGLIIDIDYSKEPNNISNEQNTKRSKQYGKFKNKH